VLQQVIPRLIVETINQSSWYTPPTSLLLFVVDDAFLFNAIKEQLTKGTELLYTHINRLGTFCKRNEEPKTETSHPTYIF
jgi:hypothetical protein